MSPVPAQPRTTVQIQLPDQRIFEAPLNSTLESFIQTAYPQGCLNNVPIVAALVDGHLRELSYSLARDAQVQPLSMSNDDGMRIYRRGLTFLTVSAALRLFPQAQVVVEHSIQSGGYFCQVRGRAPFTQAELTQLSDEMQAMVTANLPFTKEVLPLPEAVELFRARGDLDKVKLLAARAKNYLVIYRLNGFADYFHGYMVPSTGYLRWFKLQIADTGFLLQFPQRATPTTVRPQPEIDHLLATFREYSAWLDHLGLRNVGALNESIRTGNIRELVLVTEALHEQRIAHLAEWIALRQGQVRLVLISGPSSSGKTTFSKRLAVQLMAHGLHPFALAIDEYFVDREQTPRDEFGDYDFESIQALNLERFNHDLLDLMEGRTAHLPHYDFVLGRSLPGESVTLSPDTVIIAEGIHGLNPTLVPSIPAPRVARLYVSALTQLNLDHHNRVSTTDTRLIRRIVRDAATRGYTAADTLRRWDSVRKGETTRIFPYQENADVMFNSALVYELAALRPLAEPLLLQVPPDTPEYVRAKRLLSLLAWFQPCPHDIIPDNSLLREFIGGSILAQFKLWGMPENKV